MDRTGQAGRDASEAEDSPHPTRECRLCEVLNNSRPRDVRSTASPLQLLQSLCLSVSRGLLRASNTRHQRRLVRHSEGTHVLLRVPPAHGVIVLGPAVSVTRARQRRVVQRVQQSRPQRDCLDGGGSQQRVT